MVQAQNKIKKRRAKASLTLILTLLLAFIMLVLVGVFFRIGQAPQDEPRTLSQADQKKINRLFVKANALRQKNKQKEAVLIGQQIIEILEREKPDDWMMLTMAYVTTSDMYRELGQFDQATPLIKRAREIVETHHLEEQNVTCEILLREGIFKYVSKDYLEAEEYFQQALSCAGTLTGRLSAETSGALLWLAEVCLSPTINKPQKAMQYLRAVEDVCGSAHPERPQQMMTCQKVEGIALLKLQKFTEAEEKLLASNEIAQRLFPDPNNNERLHIVELLKQARAGKPRTQ